LFGNPATEVISVRWDPDDEYIAAGNSDGSIKIFEMKTVNLIHNLSGSTGVTA